MNTKAVGDIGEEIAAKYLEENGYRILERNVEYGGAEVDIICEAYLDEYGKLVKIGAFEKLKKRLLGAKYKPTSQKTVIFCEVKTRFGDSFGTGAEAVDAYKVGRYVTAARTYAAAHGAVGKPMRFDIIEVGDGRINHIKGAFDANDARYPRNRR